MSAQTHTQWGQHQVQRHEEEQRQIAADTSRVEEELKAKLTELTSLRKVSHPREHSDEPPRPLAQRPAHLPSADPWKPRRAPSFPARCLPIAAGSKRRRRRR